MEGTNMFYIHMVSGDCYRVQEATDMLTHDEFHAHPEWVAAADRK